MSSQSTRVGFLSLTLGLVLAWGASVSQAAVVGEIISINMDESQGRLTMASTDLAGANADIRVGHWNNIEADSGSMVRDGTELTDQLGNLVGGSIQVEVIHPRANALAGNAATNDQRLYSGFSEMWEAGGGQTLTVNITGIAYAAYDIYVYWGGGNSSRGGSLTLDGATFYARGTAPVDDLGNGYAQITNTDYDAGDIGGTVPSTEGNYTVAKGLTGSELSFSLQALDMGNSNWRHRLYGFQIVEVPEPSSVILLIAGSALCLARGRRAPT